MASPGSEYKISRTCNNCGHHEEIRVSKREAAFELVDIDQRLGPACTKCSATLFSTSYWTVPELDLELLTMWAQDSSLRLMEQDEDLMLADEKYLDNILIIIDTVDIPDHKRNVLMEALCAMVYNNTVNASLNGLMLRKRVVGELNKRLDKLKLADGWIMDYMKQVVYPQLNMDK